MFWNLDFFRHLVRAMVCTSQWLTLFNYQNTAHFLYKTSPNWPLNSLRTWVKIPWSSSRRPRATSTASTSGHVFPVTLYCVLSLRLGKIMKRLGKLQSINHWFPSFSTSVTTQVYFYRWFKKFEGRDFLILFKVGS